MPPSGPMDALAFRLGNALVGNGEDAAGLEFAITGPTLRFHAATTVCCSKCAMNGTTTCRIAFDMRVSVAYLSSAQLQAPQKLYISWAELDFVSATSNGNFFWLCVDCMRDLKESMPR